MRILAVRGANLASLEQPFSLNFRAEPLRSAGLYAIVGPTGSGKSTILDAICLALFDRAPRLQHGRESGAQVLDASGERLSSSDSRVLLRKGAVEGYAEVEFLGVDGHEYSSRWEVRRAAKRMRGRLQATRLSLRNIQTGQVLASEGKGECLALVVEKLGLGFEQFTRAVLLAQGDFAKFLQAKTSEKAELLERLTNSAEYARVSRAIYELHGQAQCALETIESELGSLQCMPDAELAAVRHELGLRGRDVERLQEQDRANTLLIDQLQRYMRQCQIVRDAELEDAERKGELARLEPARSLLAQWDEAQGVRPVFIEYGQAASSCDALAREVELLNGELQRVRRLHAQSLVVVEQGADALRRLQEEGQELDKLLAQAAVIERGIQDVAKHLQERAQEWREGESRLKSLQQQHAEQRGVLRKLKGAHEANRHRLEQLGRGAALFSNEAQAIELMQVYRERYEAYTKHSAHLKRLEAEEQACAGSVEEYKRQLQEVQGSVDPTVLAIRKELHAGAPCPVCGAREHPYAARVHMRVVAQSEQSRQVADLSRRLEEATRRADVLLGEQKRTQGAIAQCQADQERLRSQIEPMVAEMALAWESKLQAQPEWVGHLRGAYSQWKALKEEVQRGAYDLDKRAEQVELLAAREQEAAAASQTLQQRVLSLQRQEAEERAQLARLLGGKGASELKADHQRRLLEQAQACESAREVLRQKEAEQHALTGRQGQLGRQLAQMAAQRDHLRGQLDAWLAVHSDVGDWDTLSALLELSPERVQAKREALQQAEREALLATKLLEERRAQLATYDAATLSRYTPQMLQERKEALAQALDEVRTRGETLRLRIAEEERKRARAIDLGEQLEARRENAKHWARLNELYGSADGGRFRVMAQYYTLETLLRYANQHLAYIMPRYRIEPIPTTQDASKRSLALQIVDTELLNETRPADTLSGGETFLVSLALSLALSAFSSSAYSIESLFIDEGFGSLDPESLGVALTALERLQMQGRKVGLISHVQEMNERIAVKIEVQKQGGGRSVVVVRRG